MKASFSALIGCVSITTALLWIVCSLFVVILPELSAVLTEKMMHMDSGSITLRISWSGFFIGLVSWVVIAVSSAGLFMVVYGRLRSYEK